MEIFSLLFWDKRLFHKDILKLSDLYNETDFFDKGKQVKNNKELLELKKDLVKIRNSFFVKTCGDQVIKLQNFVQLKRNVKIDLPGAAKA